jgi:hypothetical protein
MVTTYLARRHGGQQLKMHNALFSNAAASFVIKLFPGSCKFLLSSSSAKATEIFCCCCFRQMSEAPYSTICVTPPYIGFYHQMPHYA